MFATTHILASIAISQRLPNPWWAFVVSLLSHYFLDLIPHGDTPLGPWMVADPKKRRMIYVLSADALVSALFLAFFWLNGNLPRLETLLPAMIGSILPDFIWLIRYAYPECDPLKTKHSFKTAPLNHINAFHHAIHASINHKIKKIWPGLIIQAIFFYGLIYCIVSWR